MASFSVSASVTPTRDRVSLDGVWDFRLDREEHWRAIQVPGVWQAQFDDLRETQGITWYRRNFTVPRAFAGRQVVLGFGAVNYLADVFVNGRLIASHEGGYLAFEVPLPTELLWQDNALEVRVTLPSNDRSEFPDYPFQEVPHGKQSWYGPMGGIWQPVWLEARSPAHLGEVVLGADLDTGAVGISIAVAEAGDGELVCTVTDRDGAVVASCRTPCHGETLVPCGLTVSVAAPLVARHARALLPHRRTGRGRQDRRPLRAPLRLPQLRLARRAVLAQWPALLHALCTRSGLLSRRPLHRPRPRLSGGPVPQGQGARPQHRALPHQGA